MGHTDSDFEIYFNAGTNSSTADARAALGQLSGLRGCLTDENSLAGYWVPLGYLNLNNIPSLEPIQTYSYSASIRALYIKGVCSFAATYAISADPRTSSEVITDLPDVIEKLPEWIQEHDISTVMMRGYESSGLIGRLFASHVDRVLETVNIPVLICQ